MPRPHTAWTGTSRQKWRTISVWKRWFEDGYHVYKEVWESNIGERLACETGNFYEFDVLFCNPEEIFMNQGPFVKNTNFCTSKNKHELWYVNRHGVKYNLIQILSNVQIQITNTVNRNVFELQILHIYTFPKPLSVMDSHHNIFINPSVSGGL